MEIEEIGVSSKKQPNRVFTDSTRPKVLLIDDDEDQLLIFQSLLQVIDVDVVTARSASAGRVIMGQEKVDLVICDYLMPNENGREFVARVKNAGSLASVPVIVYSASGSDSEEIFLSEGADDYCPKGEARQLIKKTKSFLNLN